MISRIARTLIDLIYPSYCLLCHKKMVSGNPNDLVCNSCLDAVIPNTPPFCQKCGRRIKGKFTTRNICPDCKQKHYHFDRAWASCAYEGNVREMIHNFKYRNKIKLKRPLSRLIIDFAEEYRLPVNHCDYIIPIPLSKSKLREREFNQSKILTEEVAAHFGLNILKDNLQRSRDTKSQTELNEDARWENIKDVFKLRNPEAVRGKTILLLDDVLTTGATASEAAKTLKSAKASVVFVLSVAN